MSNVVTLPVAGLLAAYVVVTMLLLSLNLTSLWRWWIKAASIIVTTVFFGVTWQSINGLMGWPTAQHLPPRFSLVSSRIVEPDGRTNNPGHIYLWTDTINEYNVPSGLPRSYELAYSKNLARKVNTAQEKHDQGVEVMGLLSDRDPKENKEPRGDIKLGSTQKSNDQQSPASDTVPFQEEGNDISFEDLPPVLLPDKGPPQ
jgi:hypothetical protein